MLRDENIFPPQMPSHDRSRSSSPQFGGSIDNVLDQVRPSPTNDFDDVWGSSSDSEHGALERADGDSEQPSMGHGGAISVEMIKERRQPNEVSDIPRLRSHHATAGYREGITVAKGQTIQEGFDEGYSLGATIGLRVGKVLGVLEGIYAARKVNGENIEPEHSEGSSQRNEAGEIVAHQLQTEVERLRELLSEARKELCLENVFGTSYWGTDGIWKYEVVKHVEKGSVSAESSPKDFTPNGPETDEQITFEDVAKAHPLLMKWEDVLEQETQKAHVDLMFWEKADVDRLEEGQDLLAGGGDVVRNRTETLEF